MMMTIDLELMWGFNKAMVERPWERCLPSFRRYVRNMRRARETLASLLRATEELGFPLTWAVVGHLALDRCDCPSGVPHPDMPRPRTASGLDWYAFDPCSDVGREPLWYGSDMVEAVLDSPVEHEIACHSFSHVDFSACDRRVAEAEVAKCISVLKERFGVRPVSFVFPHDRVGHLDVLAKHGIKVFRAPISSLLWPLDGPESIKATVMSVVEEPMASRLRAPRPPGRLRRVGALVRVPKTGSLYRPSVSELTFILYRLSRALSLACRRGLVLHVCAHLHELAQGPAYLRAFKLFMRMVKDFEEQGLLRVLTMRDANKHAR